MKLSHINKINRHDNENQKKSLQLCLQKCCCLVSIQYLWVFVDYTSSCIKNVHIKRSFGKVLHVADQPQLS